MASPNQATAVERQDQHPQHHRAFVITPHRRELVEERFLQAAVLGDVQHREIRDHVSVHQRREGEGDEDELRQRCRARRRHRVPIAARRAGKAQAGLQHGHGKRQDEREMAQLDNHDTRRLGAVRRGTQAPGGPVLPHSVAA
jgi:hypothetical protein